MYTCWTASVPKTRRSFRHGLLSVQLTRRRPNRKRLLDGGQQVCGRCSAERGGHWLWVLSVILGDYLPGAISAGEIAHPEAVLGADPPHRGRGEQQEVQSGHVSTLARLVGEGMKLT